MTTFLKDEAEGERAIEEISRAAYEYFSRLGAGGVAREIERTLIARSADSASQFAIPILRRPRRIVRRTRDAAMPAPA